VTLKDGASFTAALSVPPQGRSFELVAGGSRLVWTDRENVVC
jgi:hypothetical protein